MTANRWAGKEQVASLSRSGPAVHLACCSNTVCMEISRTSWTKRKRIMPMVMRTQVKTNQRSHAVCLTWPWVVLIAAQQLQVVQQHRRGCKRCSLRWRSIRCSLTNGLQLRGHDCYSCLCGLMPTRQADMLACLAGKRRLLM